MTNVVSIDVARVRAAAGTVGATATPLDDAARAITACEVGSIDAARDRAIREGYLRLARAIGVWGYASDRAGRGLAKTADTYERRDAVIATTVARAGRR